MLFLDSYPLSPFPHGKGECIAPASAPMRVQAETAEGGLNENIGKTPKGVFPIFSFAREARRTAPSVVSVAEDRSDAIPSLLGRG